MCWLGNRACGTVSGGREGTEKPIAADYGGKVEGCQGRLRRQGALPIGSVSKDVVAMTQRRMEIEASYGEGAGTAR